MFFKTIAGPFGGAFGSKTVTVQKTVEGINKESVDTTEVIRKLSEAFKGLTKEEVFELKKVTIATLRNGVASGKLEPSKAQEILEGLESELNENDDISVDINYEKVQRTCDHLVIDGGTFEPGVQLPSRTVDEVAKCIESYRSVKGDESIEQAISVLNGVKSDD
jgi:hypothetical protein